MERASPPRDRYDKTRSLQVRSTTCETRVLEGRDVKDAHAEYRSWSCFSPDPVLIGCTSAPGETCVGFAGLSFKMIKEVSGGTLYHFTARKTAHGWHTREPWHLELRIYDKAGDVLAGLAYGALDLITVAGVYCTDDGNKISAMNSLTEKIWAQAQAIEVTFPSHPVFKC